MKIFIPFTVKDIGGTATFVEKFSRKLAEQKISVSEEWSSDFDVLFIVADCPILYPLRAKFLGKRVVQRLDGVYHPATPAGWLYPLYNLKMQVIHNWLADTVIYQSEFSKLSCEKFLGKTRARRTDIIYNGVEIPTAEHRSRPRNDSDRIHLVTFAKFRRRDQIEPLIESVKLLDPKKYTFDIYGSYTDNLTGTFLRLSSSPNIHFLGKFPNSELLKKISEHDIFLFSDQSACPNSVLEALAAGLPVVAFDRGSIPELIESGYNGEIAPVQNNSNPFKDPYPFEIAKYSSFAASILKVTKKLGYYTANIRSDVQSRFSLELMMDRYEHNLR